MESTRNIFPAAFTMEATSASGARKPAAKKKTKSKTKKVAAKKVARKKSKTRAAVKPRRAMGPGQRRLPPRDDEPELTTVARGQEVSGSEARSADADVDELVGADGESGGSGGVLRD